MSVNSGGPKFSESLYGRVGHHELGLDFHVEESDPDGKASIWVTALSQDLRSRAAFLDLRNNTCRTLQRLGFQVETELQEYKTNPFERRLTFLKDGNPNILIRLDPQSIEIGLTRESLRENPRPFLNVQRSLHWPNGDITGERIVMKALRTITAIEEGAHVPTALDSFLYEHSKDGDPLDVAAPCTPKTRREFDPGAARISIPSSGSLQRFLEDIPCFRPHFIDTPYPQMWRQESGMILVAYNLIPEYAQALADEMKDDLNKCKLTKAEGASLGYGSNPYGATGFRTIQERRRDKIVDDLSRLGYQCFFPCVPFSASDDWFEVSCDWDTKSSLGAGSAEHTGFFMVSFRRNSIEINYDGTEFNVPHASSGGAGDTYSIIFDICRTHAIGELTEECLIKRLPKGWRRINNYESDDFSGIFGVGDYIGDGIRMTANGPADVGR